MIRIRRTRLYAIVALALFFLILYLSMTKTHRVEKKTIIEEQSPKINAESFKNKSLPLSLAEIKLEVKRNIPNVNVQDKYIFPIEAARINRLFRKLYSKEKEYASVLDTLELPSFEKIINLQTVKNFDYKDLLESSNGQVVVTDKFLDYLKSISFSHSFSPRKNISRANILNDEDKPVIVTAANSNYYDPLQATVFHVHKYFPDYRLIVYDLGLDNHQYEKTLEKCKCEVKKFDVNNVYSKISPHVSDLKKFSWKPLIIQETLLIHKTVLYIDSSIRFLNSEIAPIVNTCKNVGMLTQYIGLKLVCYTDPKMFEWFEEKPNSYEDFFTIEANILMFHSSFLTSILMKAWITCAMDENCIAPPGSSTAGCCGCHRYDQDGLTIINSFFFGHPKDINFLPAYSFTTHESYFFEIRRYAGMKYFE